MALRCKRCETDEWLAVGRHRQSRHQSPIQAGVHGRAGLRSTVPSMEPAPPLLPGGTSRELFLPRVEERRPDGAPTLSTFRNDPNAMESWPAGTGRMVSDDAGLVSLDVTSV